ncbi:MAG TPA: serine/threonine-protein kinase [Polyangiaceae bacterium]|nr:serine/threonine-protein kinase [Polyangiaceae bacterium]
MIDIGSVVNGKYRLVRILGDGGMGSVYEAQHAVLATRVAIKVLHPELTRRTGLVERFLQEARVAAQIRSPHVVQVIDVDRTSDGHAYIVMELLEGEPLSSVLDRQRRLPVNTACEYTVQVLEALEAAHSLGVVHRDLKPENVFVTFAGGRPVLKLIDFGIAKARRDPRQKNLTVAGVVMGTAEYMAPEQARSADLVDPRADLYAVGVMLYEMIAGARPVHGDSGQDARVIALKVERGEVIPLVQAAPDTPRDIAGHVHHAMAARPDMRFSTATEMRLAIEGALAGKHGSTTRVRATPSNLGAGPGGTMAIPHAGARVSAVSPMVGMVSGPPTGPATGPPEMEPHVDTVRAPPIATAMAAPYAGGGALGGAFGGASGGVSAMMPGQAGPSHEPRRRVPLAALLGLAVLLGVSVVGILVGTGTIAFSSSPEEPIANAQGTETATAAATAAPTGTPAATGRAAANGTATATNSPVPTLATTRSAPSPAPRPAPSARPVDAPDAGGAFPPFILPTALPTAFPPFPSGFPLPAGFPSSLPSGFPTVFPGWPTAAPPTSAAPKQAASSVPAGY